MLGSPVANVIALIEKYYRPIGEKFAKGKHYGCLALRGPLMEQKPLVATVPFGVIPKESGCYTFAPEKVDRLAGYPDHWSSYESRDPDRKRWGGAIRLPDTSLVIGFMSWSSYPELVDEAFKLAVAVEAGLMEVARAEFVASRGRQEMNEFLHPILDLMSVGR